jgi:hypothetical protein
LGDGSAPRETSQALSRTVWQEGQNRA